MAWPCYRESENCKRRQVRPRKRTICGYPDGRRRNDCAQARSSEGSARNPTGTHCGGKGGPVKSNRNWKALRVKTEAATHIVVRNGTGKKLCDIDVIGVSITVTVPPDAEIDLEPGPSKSLRAQSASQRSAAPPRRK